MEDMAARRTPHLFDASAYLLFEASGDSEAPGALLDLEPGTGASAEDDAQSCSYGSLSDTDEDDEAHVNEVDIDVNMDLRGGDEEEDGGSEGEEDGVVDQCRRKEKALKSNDSNAKMMNEREGDRLFWEACLAS
ncbi:uncharacterized protein LOC105163197 [Sesamum indicum]|uniref:Uncharacterized protein LOC105163197 n=1 Tax=Sesamum indicum TaxID=4182 RepID=A0A6I9T6M6_SESIN|nr:uncharacterized protein LOC105163197 [Sesamum indicum]XP_020550535.1 uncharacterized protein LOC105163197 [Sesamum indicum]XP_020550536.1 uncharacterized protein LOC105163197 [Sesamum indicum]XP_020550537.1 uncharacterized protein LOC105163197 [Sesamum indicum]